VGCSRQAEQPTLGPALVVMTFNIRYGTAADGSDEWQRRRDLLIDVIRSEAPDVLGLQEALRFQLDDVQRALPHYAVIGVGRDDGVAKGEFAAILYRTDRFEVSQRGTFWFSDTPDQPGSVGWGARIPRIATWARLVDRQASATFDVYNVHWDHESQASRQQSAALLRDRLRARTLPNPVIVTGDFNAGEENPAFTSLVDPAAEPRLSDTFRDRHPEAAGVIGTYHGFRGSVTGEKIDAVLASPDWEVLDAAIVHTSRDGRYPSDHYPVTARLALRLSSETSS
jgi:endonuclease/exonuclease/phosphatase family metal-dependent hydrolase